MQGPTKGPGSRDPTCTAPGSSRLHPAPTQSLRASDPPRGRPSLTCSSPAATPSPCPPGNCAHVQDLQLTLSDYRHPPAAKAILTHRRSSSYHW